MFLDIASLENRGTTIELATKLARELFYHLQSEAEFPRLITLLIGTAMPTKLINSSALKNPDLITEGAKRFGSQCIVVAIDAKKEGSCLQSRWDSFTGRMLGLGPRSTDRGAGEVLLTSMDADGHKSGFDNPLNSQVSTMLSIPVIASGGGGTLEHFRDAIKVGKADAVLAASVFHYGTYTVSKVKQFLRTSRIPVRL